jgi:hypothetical protein
MRRLKCFLGFVLGGIALGTLGGCGDPLKRQTITGEVKLKGQPVEDGIIQFHPLDGQSTGDGAQIVKGQYQIPREKGLSPGKYRVSIYAGNGMSGEGNAVPGSPNAEPIMAKKRTPVANKERVPPEYNEKSKLVREVTQDGPNKFDFEIP